MTFVSHSFSVNLNRGGCALVTREVSNSLQFVLKSIEFGILLLFADTEEATLSINENADPSVRVDLMEAMLHVSPVSNVLRRVMMGRHLFIPIYEKSFRLGTWQGIYCCLLGKAEKTVTVNLHAVVRSVSKTDFAKFVLSGHRGLTLDKNLSQQYENKSIVHFIIQHTSASYFVAPQINELDKKTFEKDCDQFVPQKWNREFFTHIYEGDDDMPGHVKSTLFTPCPFFDSNYPQFGYLVEHREGGGFGGMRRNVISVTESDAQITLKKMIKIKKQSIFVDCTDEIMKEVEPTIARISNGFLFISVGSMSSVFTLLGPNNVVLQKQIEEISLNLSTVFDIKNMAPTFIRAMIGTQVAFPIIKNSVTALQTRRVIALNCVPENSDFELFVTVFGE